MGDAYYLHEGRTKTGKPRYFFAKKAGAGALTAMPAGFEVSESINGVVSVRRKTEGESSVPERDVKLVEAAIERHAHLRWYLVRAVDNAIVIFEPHPRPEQLLALAPGLGPLCDVVRFVEERMKRAQYAPVLKLERDGDAYAVHRMTYRGEGGWSWSIMHGKLADVAKKVVPKVGTEAFYDLA
jgi:hypothetical protein